MARKKISGIYQIRNLLNGKIYIGSSVNIAARWSTHKCKLRKNKHNNGHLQNAWNKYREESFVFELLEDSIGVNNLMRVEQMYFDRLHPEYNIAKYATVSPMTGRHHTTKSKQRMSNAQKGKSLSDAHKTKIGLGHLGRKCSKATLQRMSDAKKGKNNPSYGKSFSDNHKNKISVANSGERCFWWKKSHTEETRRKMTLAKRGEGSYSAKMTWKKVRELRELWEAGKHTRKELVGLFGISYSAVCHIISCITWIE